MSDTLLVTILGIAGSLISGVTFFVLGKRAERHRQSLQIRANMLEPIQEWIGGAERLISIFSDTLVSLTSGAPLPITFNYEERKKASIFMSENTNEVLGILDSNSLQVWKTRRLSRKLAVIIRELDKRIKYELLPKESMLVELSNQGKLTESKVVEGGELKIQLEQQIQHAYSLISQVKTRLT